MDKEFEIEVVQRLSRIEQKIDTYEKVKGIAYEANNRSKENEKDIKTIMSGVSKSFWVATAAIVSVIVKTVIDVIKNN